MLTVQINPTGMEKIKLLQINFVPQLLLTLHFCKAYGAKHQRVLQPPDCYLASDTEKVRDWPGTA